MNEDEITFDGCLHIANDKQAYISQKITEKQAHEMTSGVNGLKMDFLKKIAQYVLTVDEEKALEWLGRAIWDNRELNIEFIFKPAQMVSILAQYSTLAVKIERLEDDEDFFIMDELTTSPPLKLPEKADKPSQFRRYENLACCEEHERTMTKEEKDSAYSTLLQLKSQYGFTFKDECKAAVHDEIKHPSHYQGKNGMEAKDVAHNFDLNFNLGSAMKYILRAGKKDDLLKDLKKAIEFLTFEVEYEEAERLAKAPDGGS